MLFIFIVDMWDILFSILARVLLFSVTTNHDLLGVNDRLMDLIQFFKKITWDLTRLSQLVSKSIPENLIYQVAKGGVPRRLVVLSYNNRGSKVGIQNKPVLSHER